MSYDKLINRPGRYSPAALDAEAALEVALFRLEAEISLAEVALADVMHVANGNPPLPREP